MLGRLAQDTYRHQVLEWLYHTKLPRVLADIVREYLKIYTEEQCYGYILNIVYEPSHEYVVTTLGNEPYVVIVHKGAWWVFDRFDGTVIQVVGNALYAEHVRLQESGQNSTRVDDLVVIYRTQRPIEFQRDLRFLLHKSNMQIDRPNMSLVIR
jgi:hypothetical protein